MFILSSPSGAGKSSLTRALVLDDLDTKLAISSTTRKPRPGEEEGKDYFFIENSVFDQMVADGKFLEHATVFDHRYGTLKSEVEPYLSKGIDVIFDVDWQGARSLRNIPMVDVVSIYILPPSVAELKNRLLRRRQDSIDVIERRMERAIAEISHYNEYDYIVINDVFESAVRQVRSILEAERLKLHRLDLIQNILQH